MQWEKPEWKKWNDRHHRNKAAYSKGVDVEAAKHEYISGGGTITLLPPQNAERLNEVGCISYLNRVLL